MEDRIAVVFVHLHLKEVNVGFHGQLCSLESMERVVIDNVVGCCVVHSMTDALVAKETTMSSRHSRMLVQKKLRCRHWRLVMVILRCHQLCLVVSGGYQHWQGYQVLGLPAFHLLHTGISENFPVVAEADQRWRGLERLAFSMRRLDRPCPTQCAYGSDEQLLQPR
jgi:hypothetical protein